MIREHGFRMHLAARNELRMKWPTGGRTGRLVAQIEAEVQAAVQFAEASPYPADEELNRDVYAEPT